MDRLLQTYLEPVARDYRRWQLWRALTRCWAAGAGIGLAFLLLRWLAHWSASWIFPLLLVALAGAAAVVVFRWWNAREDSRALARRIETEHPELRARLLTAIEQRPDPATGRLNYFQQRVIREALAHYRARPWGDDILDRLSRAQGAHWLVFCLLVLVMAGLRPGSPAAKGRPAVSSNGVAVTPGDTSLERGSGLVVLARFKGKLPAEATLVINPVNGAERRLPLTRNLEDPVFGGAVPEVNSDLAYRVEFPKGRTRDFKVSVFDYPRLERADAKIAYPRYTGLTEKTIPDTRRVSAVEGSTVDFAFFLNKPVAVAKLTAKDKTTLPLVVDTNRPSVYHARFTLEQSRRYELVLVDDAGRTNKIPPEFAFDALKNRPPELKLSSPRGDPRVSPLEEIAFQAEASDDFGLRAYGIAYTMGGGEPKIVPLGQSSGPNEKRPFNFLLPLETLGAQPDQLLSYYLWADDFGPDGQLRRTKSDLFFAEIRPFEEIFREGQGGGGGLGAGGGEQQQSPTQKLSELQKQIISATWNLQRRETGPQPSPQYQKDADVVRQSQEQAREQVQTLRDRLEDPRLQALAGTAEREMTKAANHMSDAARRNSVAVLASALTAEQAAGQALLSLQAHESQVARGRNSRGGGGGGGASQRQLDQLDLKQAENRYETQRQAAPAQKPEQREQLQVMNRLKELAQRQQDLNERLKELQTALQEARTEAERQEIRRRLKRLREEQQDLLADVDELRQRMDRPENQSRMSDARQQLDRARSEVQGANQALDQESVPQALTSGTRAQRDLQQLQDEFRKQTSSQFTEEMRQMRNDARQLAEKQEGITKQLDDLSAPKQKSLSDAAERRNLAQQLAQQKTGLTNLFDEMRRVSEQSETAEPLLSKQLYDLLRQSRPDEMDKSLDLSSELVRRGFLPQAGQFEQRARQNIDDLKRGVERAAEGVLGDETEALRLARRELDNLGQQLDRELAQASSGSQRATNGTPAGDRAAASDRAAGSNPASPNRGNSSAQPDGQKGQNGQTGNNSSSASASASGGERAGANPSTADNGDGRGNQRAGSRYAGGARGFDRNAGAEGGDGRGGGGGGGAYFGPLTGNEFVDWSDRLRDVEEMLDAPELRGEVARVRDRARVVRQEYKRSGKKPDWAVVRTQIAQPLAEVRSRVAEELARRESKDALVPIDRDPVPARFSELVRRYYEQLGKSD